MKMNDFVENTPKKRKRFSVQQSNSFESSDNRCSTETINNAKAASVFLYNGLMETKSIKELTNIQTGVKNPFEVVRKPPKKKTKTQIEEGCFVNEALNIDGPDNSVNPFEVKRLVENVANNYCFHNPGLSDIPNDCSIISANLNAYSGIVNPTLEVEEKVIAVPFTPTIGCRIDFGNIPLNALSPSSLLNKMLVFTPANRKQKNCTKSQTGLPIIEEQTEALETVEVVDIDKELDCYQLELENSINENKTLENKNKRKITEKPDNPDKFSANINMHPSQSFIYEDCGNNLDDTENKLGNPFVRQYFRPLNNAGKTKSNDCSKDSSVIGGSLRQSMRKSFRNLMQNIKDVKKQTNPPVKEKKSEFSLNVRRSFRQKSGKRAEVTLLKPHNCDVSVLIENNRQIFKENEKQKNPDNAKESTFVRKGLRSSFRKTRHVMRSVFKNNVQGYQIED